MLGREDVVQHARLRRYRPNPVLQLGLKLPTFGEIWGSAGAGISPANRGGIPHQPAPWWVGSGSGASGSGPQI